MFLFRPKNATKLLEPPFCDQNYVTFPNFFAHAKASRTKWRRCLSPHELSPFHCKNYERSSTGAECLGSICLLHTQSNRWVPSVLSARKELITKLLMRNGKKFDTKRHPSSPSTFQSELFLLVMHGYKVRNHQTFIVRIHTKLRERNRGGAFFTASSRLVSEF